MPLLLHCYSLLFHYYSLLDITTAGTNKYIAITAYYNIKIPGAARDPAGLAWPSPSPPPPSWRTPARAGAAQGRSLPGPGLPRAGPAFVFASPAVLAHPGPEPPGARPVRPGLDRLARPSGPGRGARPLAAARSDEDRDRIWAPRWEWVVDQHLYRAEYEQNQLQRDFEAVPACVSPTCPRKHVRGNMIRRPFLILASNLIQHVRPYGHCGGDRSVD